MTPLERKVLLEVARTCAKGRLNASELAQLADQVEEQSSAGSTGELKSADAPPPTSPGSGPGMS
jgi:hypothetical protein